MKPRLPHRRSERRTVFVLSGGGARGAAQVGMMTELMTAGIYPDALVGTSVGALNAAFVAADPTVDRVQDLARRWSRLRTRDIFAGSAWSKANHLIRRHPHVYDPDALATLIGAWCPQRRLEDLMLPLRVVTTHLGTGRAAYHDGGDLTRTLLASAALPALFPPVELPDPITGAAALHVDGGICDLVPAAGALALAPTHVYILDVTVAPLLERPRSPLDVLVACLAVSMRARDDVVFPDGVTVHHLRSNETGLRVGLMDFTHTDALVEAGAAAARSALTAPRPALTARGLGRARQLRGYRGPAPVPTV